MSDEPEAEPNSLQQPTTLNLDQLRDLVRQHFLVEELEVFLKRAKADLEAREQLAQDQLALAQVKTMPVAADEPALRVVALGAGRLLVQLDAPGADREDYDAAALNERLSDLVLAVIDRDASSGPDAAAPSALPGRNHRRPMNVTVRSTLALARLESATPEQGCQALVDAGFPELVRPAYNANQASSAARELLGELAEIQAYAEEQAQSGQPLAEADAAAAEKIKSKVATLRRAFDFKTRTEVPVTRAGNKESRSSRGVRALRKL